MLQVDQIAGYCNDALKIKGSDEGLVSDIKHCSKLTSHFVSLSLYLSLFLSFFSFQSPFLFRPFYLSLSPSLSSLHPPFYSIPLSLFFPLTVRESEREKIEYRIVSDVSKYKYHDDKSR